ncbi:zinc finger protein 845-like [Watersipora subatra]|uniref:zinc finger protein 845-like n=1 Tax=Watersipora subatra TaxID=2589382 RepID=UPI00355C41B1
MWSGTSLDDQETTSSSSSSQGSCSSDGESEKSTLSSDAEFEESGGCLELNGDAKKLNNATEHSKLSTAIGEGTNNNSSHADSQTFHCEVCNKFFKSKKVLLRHQQIHTGEKPYHCTVCEAKFTRNETLKAHMLIHKGIKPFHCDRCDYKSRCQKSVILHQKIHARGTVYRCSECEFSSIVRSDMISHLIGSHSTGRGIICHLCLFGFSSKPSLAFHMEKIHPEIANVCQTCNYRFASKSALQRHMLTHTDIRAFKCEKCDKEFRRVSTLRDHMKLHEETEALSCQLCEFTCRSQKSMNHHMASVHRTKTYKFKCSACEFSTTSGREAVATHITEAHADAEDTTSVLVVDEAVESFKIQCKVCDKTFSHGVGLKRHMLLHTGDSPSFTCPTCDRSFKRKYSLNEHLKIHTPTTYKCENCSFETNRSTLLNKHVQSMHGNIDFCCSLCGFTAKIRDDLTIHMFEKHETKKALYCMYCSFGFADRTQVCAHTEAEHPEVKIFSCEECDERFIRNSSFRRHVKTQHSALLPFQCSSCERAFNRSDKLKAHIKVHHARAELLPQSERNVLDPPNLVHNRNQTQAELMESGKIGDQEMNHKSPMGNRNDGPPVNSIPQTMTYSCSKCSADFVTSAALTTHQQNCKAQNSIHRCLLCSKTFERRPYLLRHMRKKHKTSIKNRVDNLDVSAPGSVESKTKPFTCPQCGDKFSRNSALLRHARSKHASRKPFSCNKCDKEFTRNEALTKHMQTHTEEKNVGSKSNDSETNFPIETSDNEIKTDNGSWPRSDRSVDLENSV